MKNIKLTTETTRFLNHINREQKKLNMIIGNYRYKNDNLEFELSKKVLEYNTVQKELTQEKENNIDITNKFNLFENKMVKNCKLLLQKIRVDINTKSKTCTPIQFKSGKWWSRETGGFTTDFINDMTNDEAFEAFEFYSKTELPLIQNCSMV
jgi:hypothetical protein